MPDFTQDLSPQAAQRIAEIHRLRQRLDDVERLLARQEQLTGRELERAEAHAERRLDALRLVAEHAETLGRIASSTVEPAEQLAQWAREALDR